jgi:hypothetical protein
MSHRLDMNIQVLEDLMSGKLVAWGFREGAPLEEGPAQIPAHLFPRDGDDTAAVDWDVSTLTSSGFTFVRIRVARAPRTASQSKKAEPPAALAPALARAPVEPETAKKKGRPRVDEPLRAVVQSLFEANQLKDKSRKEQIEVIRSAARLAHPTLFLRGSQPSRDKIFSALRAEGLIGIK